MDQKKIQQIFKNVIDNLQPQLDQLEQRGNGFFKKVQVIQTKLGIHIKKACASQLEWFAQNGTVNDGENGLSLTVNENISQDVANQHLDEFKSCVSKNDFGLEAFFQTNQQKQQDIEQRNTMCIEKCLESSKEENAFKSCITGCFTNTIKEMNNSFEVFDGKINEITNKL